ncbi:precorrin-6y C5,15-methyltransferase (decarboxylating) subunit CbiE [Ectopseudomonas hydrolytica]|jgi:precorrin-6Y C5,15-methyltransferase (decarboxylating)|uniref:precorrin-6y C5,15-methyltransferase (decarboxylating) subunit CbiE n=1 Tax=Ectopseudomonas hydrolytica TaxID=2493633 RepID=UPI0018A75AC9|nr:precorrin-6y C5,15-methyltransferase (decarboxylating) subunit CbiE [Pseudomonas hydrolytica]MBF8163065.1 precorrin-6y C5,15-methyltransferase (decarboxylating) subunit CbiE [Pseudomonas mendocina]UTH31667.1 precorrin-6y C5,15-methyltransferase (decarboxylating) subunit CbiE [Pseudomonas hydrolytica]
MKPWLTLVGIGEDGYPGLGKAARRALLAATRIVGAPRQLALLPPCIGGERETWPSPFDLEPLLARRGEAVCVLASGDPMFFGVGASLARQLPADELQVLPAPSSVSLAAARLGWPLQEVEVVSLVGRPLATLNAPLFPGVRLLVLSADGDTPAQVAAALRARGFGTSRLTLLEHLGGPEERRLDGLAENWNLPRGADLNLLAVECLADAGAQLLPPTCGLPDEAYRHDGQLTKRDVRAVTLARLAPLPGELLWDVGAGCGSIGIEWMRAHPACRAIAIEANEGRQAHIRHNRDALGVPGLQLVAGHAPEALVGLPAPDAIFIGGGVTVPGVLDDCWAALKPGGRLLANAVTIQSEAALVAFRERQGGELLRLTVAQAQPLGGFDTWRAALPITLLAVRKP